MFVPTRASRPTVVPPTPLPRPLSPESREVLQLIAEGVTNAEAARRLGLAVDTVKSRCRVLYRRLGARDRAHAVALGFVLGHLRAPGELDHRVDCAYHRPRVCTCGAVDHDAR